MKIDPSPDAHRRPEVPDTPADRAVRVGFWAVTLVLLIAVFGDALIRAWT